MIQDSLVKKKLAERKNHYKHIYFNAKMSLTLNNLPKTKLLNFKQCITFLFATAKGPPKPSALFR